MGKLEKWKNGKMEKYGELMGGRGHSAQEALSVMKVWLCVIQPCQHLFH